MDIGGARIPGRQRYPGRLFLHRVVEHRHKSPPVAAPNQPWTELIATNARLCYRPDHSAQQFDAAIIAGADAGSKIGAEVIHASFSERLSRGNLMLLTGRDHCGGCDL